MIRSMTGFGSVSGQFDGIHFAVELRSLNNKFFKALIRIPEEIAGLEAELESALRKQVHRGSFTLSIKYKQSDELAAGQINDAALGTYINHLKTIKDSVDGDQSIHIDLTQLLAMPGVLQPPDDQQLIDKARPALKKLLTEAVGKMNAMRVTEGQSLAVDLRSHCELIVDRLAIIAERAPLVVDEYHDRLTQRIEQLAAKAELAIDKSDLVREVAIFADRSDINEEISRMRGHLEQFDSIISGEEDSPTGRTLDFLTQEMLREANTMASKSNDAQISRAAVDIKSAVDRLKEQVQNVE